MNTCLAVVRIRGRVNVPRDIKDTLRMLRLTRANYATLVTDDPSTLGMLRRVQQFVTWGEVSREVLKLLLERRGELPGRRKLTEEAVKGMGFNSLEELVDALYEGRTKLNQLPMKPIFRLHPPSGGFKRSVKRPFRGGGEYGYRGSAINELLVRML